MTWCGNPRHRWRNLSRRAPLFESSKSPPVLALSRTPSGREQIDKPLYKREIILQESSGEGRVLEGESAVCRYLARKAPKRSLYGKDAQEETLVDHWLDVGSAPGDSLGEMDRSLERSNFLASHSNPTIADFVMYSYVKSASANGTSLGSNTKRWLDLLEADPCVQRAVQKVQKVKPNNAAGDSVQTDILAKAPVTNQHQGKLVDLPGATMGNVVVRFSPNASGYLDIGHVEAALLNQYCQLEFKGKLIVRLGDASPQEKDFTPVILQDVALLGLEPDLQTFTSDYFKTLEEYCVKLIKQGDAYVDNTDFETRQKEREARQNPKNRNNTVERNLYLWSEMRHGTEEGLHCRVRAKIDMNSDKECMRDPTIYRCTRAVHPRQGYRYKVYPTDDFACPIVDSLEDVTHALTEFRDRAELYYWILDRLGLRKPYVYEYWMLRLTNAILSRRKFTYLINEKYFSAWDDPRMPTVRGMLRRGLTVQSLKEFIISQGFSKSAVTIDWDKLCAFNKERIETTAKPYFAICASNAFEVEIHGLSVETIDVPLYPKDAAMGSRTVAVGSTLLIDHVDGLRIKPGDTVTFMNIGNVKIEQRSIETRKIVAVADLDNKDYQKTLKVSWIAKNGSEVRFFAHYFADMISKKVLAADDDFKNHLRKVSFVTVSMLGESSLANIEKGDIIQIHRKGLFICDLRARFQLLGREEFALSLNYIPDGSTNSSSLPAIAQELFGGRLETVANTTALLETLPEQEALVDHWEVIKEESERIAELWDGKTDPKYLKTAEENLAKSKNDYSKRFKKDWTPTSPLQEPEKPAVAEGLARIDFTLLLRKIQSPSDRIRKLIEAGPAISDLEGKLQTITRVAGSR